MNKGFFIIVAIIFLFSFSPFKSFAHPAPTVDGVEIGPYPCSPISLKGEGGGFDVEIVGWEDTSSPISFWDLQNGNWLFIFPPLLMMALVIIVIANLRSALFSEPYRRPKGNYDPKEFY